jgi:hypothetical protein
LADISETTIKFTVFYIIFLLFVLSIVAMIDVSIIDGVTQADLDALKGADALTMVLKFGLLLNVSSEFQIISGILLIMTIIMAYILIKEGRDLLPI